MSDFLLSCIIVFLVAITVMLDDIRKILLNDIRQILYIKKVKPE